MQELEIHATAAGLNPLLDQLTHLPFPEVAQTLRSRTDQITFEWDVVVRRAMPRMQRLTFEELKDSTPRILLAIADALGSDDPDKIEELVSCAPLQGRSRFKLNLDVLDVMQEDRLLRAITVRHVEAGMDRQLNVLESAALHAALDLMLQRSVIAMVDEQKAQFRTAAETELRFLSFLSHDLNNNLNNVTLMLSLHESDLKRAGTFAEAVESLQVARGAIDDTVTGMRRMLDHERLRATGVAPTFSRVNLHAIASRVIGQFTADAAKHGITLVVDVPPGTMADSDAELIGLVVQNLVGNGLKYSSRGTVRVGASNEAGRRTLWVSDQGPGIAPEQVGQIFEAFRRGEIHGQSGVGLGLAIASRAALLLGAELSVASTLGVGSIFRLTLPAEGGELHVRPPDRQAIGEEPLGHATASFAVTNGRPLETSAFWKT